MQKKIVGLTKNQVLASRNKYGMNQMPRPKLRSGWDFLLEVFQDKLNMFLLAMMLVFVLLSAVGYGSIYEAIGIGIVLLVVAVTTVSTKLKGQRSAEDLYRHASMQNVIVIRDGRAHEIDSTEVVVGDIIKLRAGEKICADGYIIDGDLDVSNAILNGESAEVKKTPAPKSFVFDENTAITADSYTDGHSVFAGTIVLSGQALMRVVRIGANTENAKIMSSLWSINETKTSLQIQLDQIAAFISKVGTISSVLIFMVLFSAYALRNGIALDMSLLYAVLGTVTVSITIFVAAVPEGLPFIIGIITSQNVNRMIRSNILAKNPNKIPEAGNLQLICTDKTGTLTYGFMQTVHNFTASGQDIGFDMGVGGAIKDMYLRTVALTSDCAFDKKHEIIGGNLTERALIGGLVGIADHITGIQRKYVSAERLPFCSENKFSARRVKTGDKLCYYTGAPEVILARAKHFIDADGKIHKLNKQKLDLLIHEYSAKSMRLIATAFSSSWVQGNKLPDDLIFISLVAMRDQIRTGVTQVVQTLNKSRVQIMMITGDNLDTARAIATDCNIICDKSDMAMTATEFDALTDRAAKKILHKIKVIARATPSTKLRVVQLAQSMNKSIGMCGDGTNDAPALKCADVGFAMGNGTDVCKEAGDIIITDSNFLSVANCVLLGRTFVHNVISFLRFQLPINFTLVLLSIVYPLAFGVEAFTAVQILLVNIVMDSLNSLAFGGEPPHAEYLAEHTHDKDAPLLSKSILWQIAWTAFGFCVVFAALEALHHRGMFADLGVYMSARFALLIIMSVVNGFCVRARGYNIFAGLSQNPMFVFVALGIVGATILAVTFGGAILQLLPLTMAQWACIFGMAMIVLPINCIGRALMGWRVRS